MPEKSTEKFVVIWVSFVVQGKSFWMSSLTYIFRHISNYFSPPVSFNNYKTFFGKQKFPSSRKSYLHALLNFDLSHHFTIFLEYVLKCTNTWVSSKLKPFFFLASSLILFLDQIYWHEVTSQTNEKNQDPSAMWWFLTVVLFY